MKINFCEHYEILDNGNVWSYISRQFLKPCTLKSGYLMYRLHGKPYLAHQLVASKFIPNPNNKLCVNHKNFNKKDNTVKNLEWVTHKENTRHAMHNNVFKPKNISELGKKYGKINSQLKRKLSDE